MANKVLHYIRRLGDDDRPPVAGFLLRQLTWRSDARLNELARRAAGWVHPPRPVTTTNRLLATTGDAAVRDLRERGYHIFPERLPADICDALLAFAHESPATPMGGEGASPFPEANPASPKYTLAPQALMNTEAAQRVVCDSLWQEVAQRYLGCEPVLDHIAMWWSTATSAGASSEAAQLFHMDMDLIKFVNFFVYLTDVTPETGPFTYVVGSHGHKPKPLRRDGRFTDAELSTHYDEGDFHQLVGERGTVICADTFGFHKGSKPDESHRLMFQFVFAISRIGAPTDDIALSRPGLSFREAMERHPRTFSAFRITS